MTIQGGATRNTIGGTTATARDLIAANSFNGVQIDGGGTSGNIVLGDYIGVSANGSSGLGNGASGVAIFGGASANVIGGTAAGSRDVISANNVGVNIYDSGTGGNEVASDYIGTDSTGTVALGNVAGVVLQAGFTIRWSAGRRRATAT